MHRPDQFLHALFAAISLVLPLPGLALADPGAVAVEYGTVELLRDRWGVPHVFSTTDGGAMYGLGYAAAEDRAFQMYYNLRILQGRLAELIGDVKVGVTQRRPLGRTSALRHDIAMRTIGYFQAARVAVGRLDPPTHQLLDAYAAGVNR
jgi:penicillin amidase